MKQKVFSFHNWNGFFNKECNQLIEEGWNIRTMTMASTMDVDHNRRPEYEPQFYINVLAEKD